MKLFLLENKSPDMLGDRDIYVSAVVIAEDKESAKRIYPNAMVKHKHVDGTGWCYRSGLGRLLNTAWPDNLKHIKATEIGIAKTKSAKVVCSDFNGG